jgi:signal transduction histidine kinase
VALEQIFLNLIGNSIKYNDKEKAVIDLSISLDTTHYIFKISDNGRGIPNDKLETIFDLFSTVGAYDRNGQKGHGIGLSTVKKLVYKLGGEISVASELGSYTTFTFSIAQ